MDRDLSRRTFLSTSLAALACSGCLNIGGPNRPGTATDGGAARTGTTPGDPAADASPPTGTQTRDGSPTSTPGQSSVRNVRQYGAKGDGETDDTAAIQRAIDEAGEGETVYFPGGTYLVSARGGSDANALVLDSERHAEDITIEGDPGKTVLLMEGGHERPVYITIRVFVRNGYEGLDIRNLAIDGNRRSQPGEPGSGVGVCLLISDAASEAAGNIDISVENVLAKHGKMNGFAAHCGGVVMDRVTAVDNGRHGFALDTLKDGHVHDPPLTVKHAYATRNGIDNGNGHGFDLSGGKTVIEDTVSEGNYQGSKTTGEVLEATYRRVLLSNNKVFGYIKPGESTLTGERAQVTFEQVTSQYNGANGYRFARDTDYSLDAILAVSNNRTTGAANINVTDNAALEGGDIYSFESLGGPGIFYDSDRDSSVDQYLHSGNLGGSLEMGGDGTMDIGANVTYSWDDLDHFAPDNFPDLRDLVELPETAVGVDWE